MKSLVKRAMKTGKRLLSVLFTLCMFVGLMAEFKTEASADYTDNERIKLARMIMTYEAAGKIVLRSSKQPSGVIDDALAWENMDDTRNGKAASLSNYKDKSGGGDSTDAYKEKNGHTELDIYLLRAMLDLTAEYGSIGVTEIAGGAHSKNSTHYDGIAFDSSKIGDLSASADNGREIYNFLTGKGYVVYDFNGNGVYEKGKNGGHFHIQIDGYDKDYRPETLEFDLMGGTGYFPDQTGATGFLSTIPNYDPVKQGCEFVGWSCNKRIEPSTDPETDNLFQKRHEERIYGDTKYYAVWKILQGSTSWKQDSNTEYVKLKFNLNGGTGYFPDIIAPIGFIAWIPKEIPVRPGYDFWCWSYTNTGGGKITPSSDVLNNNYVYGNVNEKNDNEKLKLLIPGEKETIWGETTVYAVWKKRDSSENVMTARFNLNGGTGSIADMQGEAGFFVTRFYRMELAQSRERQRED